MSDQFISAITDEAMTRVCYNGGWDLKPYKFLVSETDVFDGDGSVPEHRPAWPYKEAWDNGTDETREALKPKAFDYLKSVLTKEVQYDYTVGHCWYNSLFSSLSKTNEITLCHHINIPGDIAIDTPSKTVKTIYFIYKDINGEDFVYAVARANGTLIFEQGISQSFFFNFTVCNEISKEMTEFVLNYSCAQDVQGHNEDFGDYIHSNLLARNGLRDADGILYYSKSMNFSQNPPQSLVNKGITKGMALVSKEYVDNYYTVLNNELQNKINLICPPGMLAWWPGSSVPSGWTIRDGRILSRTSYPKLFALLGTKYNTGGESSSQFRLMDDRGLFFAGATTSNVGTQVAASGTVSFSISIPKNGYSHGNGHGNAGDGGTLLVASGKKETAEWLESIGKVTSNRSITKENIKVSNPKPVHRLYLPIIRLG